MEGKGWGEREESWLKEDPIGYWDVQITVCVPATNAEAAWQTVNDFLPNDIEVIAIGEPIRIDKDAI